MGTVVMYASLSVDGFIAVENDQPGPLFDWLTGGDVALDESGVLKVSQTSYDYIRPYWDQIGVTVVGRHVFDLTDGWDGTPPGGIDHVVVVTHRPAPEGWDREAPFHFVDGIEAAVATAQEPSGWPPGRGRRRRRRWPGARGGSGRRGAHGRRTRRAGIGQALLRVGRRAAPPGGP